MKKSTPTPSETKAKLDAYLRKNHPEICRHWFDEIEPVGVDGGTPRGTGKGFPARARHMREYG